MKFKVFPNNIKSQQQGGFTLIELIMVIVILGILAVVAIPKYISLKTEARIATLKQVKGAVKTANNFMKMESYMPNYSTQEVAGRDDLLDVDLSGDGVFDIRLKWGYLDNTDIDERVDFSDKLFVQENVNGVHDTFIGYDLDSDGTVDDDNCYLDYTQAADADTPPTYSIVSTGC